MGGGETSFCAKLLTIWRRPRRRAQAKQKATSKLKAAEREEQKRQDEQLESMRQKLGVSDSPQKLLALSLGSLCR